ncbi:MAG: ubiquinone/menaquinone biosynthesis methyltransferase [Candidatus Marinimicrobia bacterium]|nr:ubiquinone/menaquinone biosynthesis methyltransferase [Candidatus Neomarinimicrobiota bacterium]
MTRYRPNSEESHYRGSFHIQEKRDMARMFRQVHRRYDFFNHLFSLGNDIRWRRKSSTLLEFDSRDLILDVGAGTGDFSIAISRQSGAKVIALDLVPEMVERYRVKIDKKGLKNFSATLADGETLPFTDEVFDGVVAGFVGRNLLNLKQALLEIHRVLKIGGKVGFLEFCRTRNLLVKTLNWLYFRTIISQMGNLLLPRDLRAYTYLIDSIEGFYSIKELRKIFTDVGFLDIHYHQFNMGTVTLIVGKK